MRRAGSNVVVIRHTFNLVDLPIVVAGKTGTAEFGMPDSQGRLPFHSWFAGFVPKDPCKKPATERLQGRRGTDSELAIVVLRLRLGHEGQRRDRDREVLPPAALRPQKDYRLPDLLERGNFYGDATERSSR